jgi:hypothetical protein
MVTAIVNFLLKYEFVYIFFAVATLFIIAAAVIKKQAVKIACLILFSFFTALSATELYLAFTSQEIYTDKFDYSRFQLENHDLSEHKIDITLDTNGARTYYIDREPNNGETLIAKFAYTTYQNGFRYTKGNKNAQNSYVFLGCSFTYGEAINDDETLPYYFSQLMNFENNVCNFGINGKGLVTALNILESDILEKFIDLDKNGQIEYFIYSLIGDQIYRTFRGVSPGGVQDALLYKNNKVERVKQPYGLLKTIFARNYTFHRFLVEPIDNINQEYYEDYTMDLLLKIKDLAENKYHSKFILLIWPEYGLWNVYGNLLQKINKENFDVIYLPLKLSDRESDYMVEHDEHPSAKANKEIADILMRHINRAG